MILEVQRHLGGEDDLLRRSGARRRHEQQDAWEQRAAAMGVTLGSDHG
jgi:hypothetical protein